MAPLPRVAAVIYSARELCPALAPAPVSHPAHPHPTSQPCVPPCTLPSLPAPSQPTTHAHILPCTLPRCSTLISHLISPKLHPNPIQTPLKPSLVHPPLGKPLEFPSPSVPAATQSLGRGTLSQAHTQEEPKSRLVHPKVQQQIQAVITKIPSANPHLLTANQG